jgi:hypothetical protein
VTGDSSSEVGSPYRGSESAKAASRIIARSFTAATAGSGGGGGSTPETNSETVSNNGLFSSTDAKRRLERLFELDYLAHVVFRIYEEMAMPLNDPRRFRIEIGISRGVGDSPSAGGDGAAGAGAGAGVDAGSSDVGTAGRPDWQVVSPVEFLEQNLSQEQVSDTELGVHCSLRLNSVCFWLFSCR